MNKPTRDYLTRASPRPELTNEVLTLKREQQSRNERSVSENVPLTFQNGFVSNPTQEVEVFKQRVGEIEHVYMNGSVCVTGGTNNTVAFTIPPEFAPDTKNQSFICANGGAGGADSYFRVTIDPDGDVAIRWNVAFTVEDCFVNNVQYIRRGG